MGTINEIFRILKGLKLKKHKLKRIKNEQKKLMGSINENFRILKGLKLKKNATISKLQYMIIFLQFVFFFFFATRGSWIFKG